MSLTDDFLADPVNYCTPRVSGGKGQILIVAERDQVALNLKAGYSSVSKLDRVSYCRIAQGVSVAQQQQRADLGPTSGAVAAEIKKNPPNVADFGKRAGEWFPCYYLPWQAQAAYRTTLKCPQGFLDEPRIFVTSTVDGCSVIVEGSPENPTVYHLNDSGGGGVVPNATTLVAQQAYWAPKAATMETQFQSAHSPKAVRAQAADPNAVPLPGAKGVHAMDYMDVTQAQKGAYDTDVDRYSHGQRARQMIADAVTVKFMDTIYKPYGTVFGWKQNATWRFFYQRRAAIFYTYRITDKAGKQHLTSVPRQCGFDLDEFWPNGSGVAVGKALVP